jgi:phage terminase small subunit
MGNAGPQPKTVKEFQPLKHLTPPDWLGDEAKNHWNYHAKYLCENQLLSVQTAPNFALLCDLWERLTEFRGEPTSRTYLDLWRQYKADSKVWRLQPTTDFGKPIEHRAQLGKVWDEN